MTRAVAAGRQPQRTLVRSGLVVPPPEYGWSVRNGQPEFGSSVLPFCNKDGLAYAVWMEFGQRLAARRKDKGLSMEALGKKLGENGKDVTKQTVWGWEDGRHFPKADQLAEICRRLECSSDFLLFGTEGALSPASTDLGRKLDAIANPQAREQAYQICYGAIQMAGNLPAPESHEVTQQVTRKAG